jgi:predicted O-methyltransferase YrrM
VTVDPGELQGLVPPEVGDTLRQLASEVPGHQAIVEIGSYRGKSTAYLARGALEGGGAKVHAVDPWDLKGNTNGKHGFARPEVREHFEEQLDAAGVSDQVVAHRSFSEHAAAQWNEWGEPVEIGLLYIDGDHNADSVERDFFSWLPHLADNAIVVFDDLDTPRNPGVRYVVDSLAVEEILTCEKRAGRLAVGRWHER